MKKVLFAAVAVAALAGCVTVNKNDGARECLQPDVKKDAVHMSYKLGDKVADTETIHWINLGWISFSWGGTADHVADHAPMGAALPFIGPSVADQAKNGAYAKACAKADADSIVAARYKVTNTSYVVYGKAVAEVSGYPAKVAGVEMVPAK